MTGHPEGLPAQQWSVYGCWAQTGERFAEAYYAPSPRGAEDLAQMDAVSRGGTLLVTRVVAGVIRPADTYTVFVDPADPRNQDVAGLAPDTPDYAGGDPEWTVFGIAAPAGATLGGPDIGVTGERYGDVINATSPGAAEDVARSRIADQGGQLWVVTVLPGRVTAADTYATFTDPDVQPARRQ